MSESTNEVVEITDNSINIETSLLHEIGNKRRLSESEDQLESDKKKLCTEDNETETLENTSSIIETPDTRLDESNVENETVVCLDNSSTKEISFEEESTGLKTNEGDEVQDKQPQDDVEKEEEEEECLLEAKFDEKAEEVEELVGSEDEEENHSVVDEKSIGEESQDEENSDDEIDDEALMMRINKAMPLNKEDNKNKFQSYDASEPIALDSDTEDEAQNAADDRSENSADAMPSDEEMEEEEEEEMMGDDEEEDNYIFKRTVLSPKSSLRMRLLNYNPKFYRARVIVKRSIKYGWKNEAKSSVSGKKEVAVSKTQIETPTVEKESILPEKSIEELPKDNDVCPKRTDTTTKCQEGEVEQIEMNDVEMKSEEPANLNDNTKAPIEKMEVNDNSKVGEKSSVIAKEQINDVTKSAQNHNAQDVEVNVLLNEIENCSVDEIMNRYVLRNNEQSTSSSPSQPPPPTLDEFTEELFFCLQQNKIEIQRAQQVWNEKVHLKFKIREVMERIRRHRAVTDIENFGYKPAQDGGHHSSGSGNVLVSSKSSTTNSENDHYDRSSKLTSESVSRLIQDVKANVLKKEQQRIDDYSAGLNTNDSYDDNSSFALNSHMQNFGRQGQTIDVQSIINDFRQKNPQEIPRRGRRVKNSFESNFMNETQSQLGKIEQRSNNVLLKSNTSSGGFPEVSLVPVNNFYKNHSNPPASLSPFTQKSSLLQSILTKQQTTKSPVGYPQSSTLQRLLTAPERSFQSVSRQQQHQQQHHHQQQQQQQANMNAMSGHSKVHNNGEITITPIAGTSKKQEYSMDDEENSTEPPLVIDESDDFELCDRTRELICQGCRKNKALFMCAGCSRQWYCSKECQELAWNDHENSCF